jgi:hypothetical protein
MQLVLGNWANFQLQVSLATENQLHKTVAKWQISSSDLAQAKCNQLIFLKGKIAKRDVLCLLDTGASHNFITRESAERMEF